ncbi:DEAD/DEAH box helicase [Carboxylicivirga linearis]|uniref:DEAD/DEAH box helicase n=1 Tax=Carboxylicivirga linearis TaxID=1628157 RepID=A0ABS5JXL9_9BACT|nr:DEAD/DEAH box helicase [Carboxylicivirga linearis]MBS2099204.1 DEAD/DEAH box helicase [Carboxylicivirga linearis]
MTIIEKLTEDILNDEYFNQLFRKSSLLSAYNQFNILNIDTLSEKELKDILRYADILSNSTNSIARNKAYQIITFLNTNYSNDPIYMTVSKAVYSKLGNFPAIKYLEEYNENNSELPLNRLIEVEAKTLIQQVPGSDKFTFTDAQFELFSSLSNSIEYSFSAPTSMGKSFIIKAFIKKVIKNVPPENLVVIVPTRALINQFAIDLKRELTEALETYKYRVVTNSSVSDLITEEQHNYIFVLTPERLISYLSQENNPSIGFLFVDEAHKIASNKDSRSVTSYAAIEKALKKYGNIKLYFASPNVSNPEIFLKLFNRNSNGNSYKTSESPVSQNLFFVDLLNNKIDYIAGNDNVEMESEEFFSINNSIDDLIKNIGREKNNLIYCNSKNRTINYAFNYSKSLNKIPPNEQSSDIKKAINQIKEYIHPDYYLANLLEYKIAYHYGKLPQLIRNSVEELYQNGDVTNVFCTSTLLEGVNMPTQNIFILNNKNGSSKLEPIDFWNLSGRAGRLSKELYGNIYCVQHSDCEWENKEILHRNAIELKPTVLNRIDRNIQRIEKLLREQEISTPKTEKEILQYIANIISVDTMELQGNREPSPLLKKLIEKNKETIIELAKSKVQDFTIPVSILNSNQSINLSVQNKVFNELLKRHKRGVNIKLPSINQPKFYKVCKRVLDYMFDLYEWKNAEKKLNNPNSLSYYATIMTQWVKGFSLNQIIQQSIEYHNNTNKEIILDYDYNNPIVFNPRDKRHINYVIENVIEDIEYILRFLFEKYFNHYHSIVVNLLGEENAGENWATLLEYGTQNRIVIALQNTGISRHTAIKVYEKCRNSGLIIRDNKLERIDKQLVLQKFRKTSMEYDELIKIL